MNNKRDQLNKAKKQTYKNNSPLTPKTAEDIQKELSMLQGLNNKDIMKTYYCTRKGV